MRMLLAGLVIAGFASGQEVGDIAAASGDDWRCIDNGREIPSQGYADQPYVVVLQDGTWVCVLTTGPGQEGDLRQHIVSTRSTDQGATWSPLVDIEPSGPPEASWVMPLLVPSGRIYAFYVYNSDNVREVKGSSGQLFKRVDTLGKYFFKYSDDGGQSWSAERYEVPIREFACDRENVYGGAIRFFWGVGKPIIHDGVAYIGLSKVGALGQGFLEESEGIFLRSDTVVSEPDVTKIRWETLPDGDVGLKAPKGPIAEEQNLVALSDGSLYCTYRTTEGHPCHAYSRNGGHTWDNVPQYMTYAPGGRVVKHPRAANFVWKCANGKYLYWFHNHGGQSYEGRNPVWLSGGVEKDGFIHWSQPEIVLYADEPKTRMSYPCLVEDKGKYFLTETQKTIARVHEIDSTLLDGLWNQDNVAEVSPSELVPSVQGKQCGAGNTYPLPPLRSLTKGGGFTVELWVTFDELSAGQVLVDWQTKETSAFALTTTEEGTVALLLDDGTRRAAWDCDPGLLKPQTLHHIVAIVDGGPKIITFLVDGWLCDGGTSRMQGWGRFDAQLDPRIGTGQSEGVLRVAPSLRGELKALRYYGRPLRTSEAIGNWRAGL